MLPKNSSNTGYSQENKLKSARKEKYDDII